MTLPSVEQFYSRTVRKLQREKRTILAALPLSFAGINMLGELTVKAEKPWL